MGSFDPRCENFTYISMHMYIFACATMHECINAYNLHVKEIQILRGHFHTQNDKVTVFIPI